MLIRTMTVLAIHLGTLRIGVPAVNVIAKISGQNEMKTPRYHRCEKCLKIYCCPECYAGFSDDKTSVFLYGPKTIADSYACDFRCSDCREEKAS